MTLRISVFALVALFAGNAFAAGGSSFSIYFNGESSTANCHVDNVSNAQLSTTGSGNLVATAATPLAFSSACGISGGGQQLTFGPAQPLQGPSSTLANGTNVVGNFSVLPLNASSCTVAFNPTANVTPPSSGYVCGPSGSQTCSPSAPISFSASFTNTGSSTASWQATVNCTATTGASPASLASNMVTVNQNGTGSVGGTSCTTGQTGDVSGYSAICSGSMTLYNPAAHPQPSSPYTFSYVFGATWPGTYFGDTEVFTIGPQQFLSIPFTPSPGHSIGIATNQTYSPYGYTMTISKTMGQFNPNNPNVVCSAAGGVIQFTSNNTAGLLCGTSLDPNSTYWFNVILAKSTYNSSTLTYTWAPTCSTSSCQLSFGESKIN